MIGFVFVSQSIKIDQLLIRDGHFLCFSWFEKEQSWEINHDYKPIQKKYFMNYGNRLLTMSREFD